jgi:hypothetical protein
MFWSALKLAVPPSLIALCVTLARFFSEKAEVPSAVSFIIGIAWLTLIVGTVFGYRLATRHRPYRLLFLTLLIFSILSRIPVVAMWWVTKTYTLGTHYDVFLGWGQALQAQFVFGVVQQLVTGGLLGAITMFLTRRGVFSSSHGPKSSNHEDGKDG